MKLEVQIKDNKIFAPLLGKYLVLKPEEKVRQEYI
jgi:type I restriction enzyme M protein